MEKKASLKFYLVTFLSLLYKNNKKVIILMKNHVKRKNTWEKLIPSIFILNYEWH